METISECANHTNSVSVYARNNKGDFILKRSVIYILKHVNNNKYCRKISSV